MSDVQRLFDTRGGAKEQRAKVVSLRFDDGGTNIVGAYDEDGAHIADVGWRPFENGFFIC